MIVPTTQCLRWAPAVGVLALVCACAEATPVERPDASREPDASMTTDDASPEDAPANVDVGAASDASSAALVLNELAPDGSPDFLELYNPTSSPVEVGALMLADADGVGVMADPTHRITFPALSVGPGEYLVVAMNVDPPSGATETPVGPVSPCPVSHVDTCLQTSFGIGRTADSIVLLARDGTTELARVDYTGDLMGADASYGRFPNGTGDFTVCTSTPGAPNER